MGEELLPCPFCGGQPRETREPRFGLDTKPNEPEGWAFSVTCRSCAAVGPWSKGPGFPEDDPDQKMGPDGARRLWNHRAAPDADALLRRIRERVHTVRIYAHAGWIDDDEYHPGAVEVSWDHYKRDASGTASWTEWTASAPTLSAALQAVLEHEEETNC